MKEMFKDFGKNFKEYISYLMKVGFKDLFINVLILFCIIVLATFVYIPVGLVEQLIFDFLKIFGTMPIVVSNIYHWVFQLISFILAVFAFIYLFNLRFKDVKEKGIDTKVEITKKGEEKVTLDLPKKKDE